MTSSGDCGRIDDRVKKSVSVEKRAKIVAKHATKTKMESLPGLSYTKTETNHFKVVI